MAHRILCKFPPFLDLLLPLLVKPIFQPRRLDGQIGVFLRSSPTAYPIIRERGMAVREIHKALQPLSFIQLDELLGLLDGRCRARRPLRELPL